MFQFLISNFTKKKNKIQKFGKLLFRDPIRELNLPPKLRNFRTVINR